MQNYMTQFFVLLVFVTLAIGCQQQVTEVQPEQQSATTEQQYRELVVEAACGQCVFGLPEKGCDLAIRTEGKTYYVDGIEIDDHGMLTLTMAFVMQCGEHVCKVVSRMVDSLLHRSRCSLTITSRYAQSHLIRCCSMADYSYRN